MGDTKRSTKQARIVERNIAAPGSMKAVMRLFYEELNPERLPGRDNSAVFWAVADDDEAAARALLGETVTIGISSAHDQFARLVIDCGDRTQSGCGDVDTCRSCYPDHKRYDVQGLAQNGIEAFWKCIADVCKLAYPEITTGDLDPAADLTFGRAAEVAVRSWLEANAPRAAFEIAIVATLAVEMRGPKTGERGWLVKSNNPVDALAEVIRESEELGWVAPHDYPDDYTDLGMRIVTVVVRNNASKKPITKWQDESPGVQAVLDSWQKLSELP